ncbi:MAG TPA: hypothetical protein VNM37_11520, partial [Candidatus Dormibacteraeota bacterium]|nr:hypothetical protein [Candidatus Dormibacteraeota bacterium]
VLLAISIAIGILVVALHFYGQAVDLRSRLLQESDRVSSVRLLLDRLTTDLRSAYAQPQVGFTGDSASLRFVVTVVPSRANWNGPSRSRHGQGGLETDLTVVQYGAARALEGTNSIVTGLTRTAHAFLEMPNAVSASQTNQHPAAGSGRSGPLAAAHGAAGPAPDSPALVDPRVPVFDDVRFVMFSFWDGTGWSDRWDGATLPAGVEVTVGGEPLPDGVDPLDYPYEIFRRVIYLPGSRRTSANDDPLADLFE